MITEIIAKDFKGLTFNQPITGKTIFLGENGIGKSARTQALTLALLGYIPGSSKLNEDILNNYGSTDLVSVGFKLDNFVFERAWGKTSSGSVKEAFKINDKRCAKEFFLQTLGEKGLPKVFDLSLFLNLSDQKKIDYILNLYPASGDLSQLETMIETQKKNILLLEDKARNTEKASATLLASRATMQLPPGSLAETTANIEQAEKDLSLATQEFHEINAKNLEEKTKLEAEQKAAGEAALAKAKSDAALKMAEANRIAAEGKAKKAEAEVKQLQAEQKTGTFEEWSTEGFKLILKSILDTMDAAGCDVCAAKTIIKKEIRKLK